MSESANLSQENSASLQSPRETMRSLQNQKLKFMQASAQDRPGIERQQSELSKMLEIQAKQIIKKTEDPAITEEVRDEFMGEYGFIMDQLAISLPLAEITSGKGHDIQSETLQKLQSYFEINPQAAKVAWSIFLLFHHGAGINKNLTIQDHQDLQQNRPSSTEYARQYVDSENQARVYLEKYLAINLGRPNCSLDEAYQELSNIDQFSSDHQFSYTLDLVNWYRRIAYYQRLAGQSEGLRENVQRAINLHKKLIKRDPGLNQTLDAIFFEQQIAKTDK